MADLSIFHLTHVAEHGNWEEIDVSKAKGYGDFGKKLYTNCNLQGTLDYISHSGYLSPNVLVLPFDEAIWNFPTGYSEWGNLSVYCFGYYPSELDDEQVVLFCRTIWDNRRGDHEHPTIDADIIIGPRADRYIDAEMNFIDAHYEDEQALIDHFDVLMKRTYEPQVAFNQRACNHFFYDVEPSDWIQGSDYIEQSRF